MSKAARVLVVDDDLTIRTLLEKGLGKDGREVVSAIDGGDGLAKLDSGEFDLVLLDINLPDRTGLEVFRDVRDRDRKLPVIFMTSSESSDMVIEALKLGAYDYIPKPLDLPRLAELTDRAVETRRRMKIPVAVAPPEEDDPEPADQDLMIGRSQGMIEVFRAIAQCAKQDVSVLIRGDSGTGKELVARAVYQHGIRSEAPFLAVNCAALNENLLESELFGHEKGSFTGADKRHIGSFERCDGGTIFLDEIGDMAIGVQAKVLRLLQQQEFQRVGGTETIKTDVRVIAATNRPLESMFESGEFREDLFHRLNGYEIHLPPLADRSEDVQPLIEYFVKRAQTKLSLDGFEGVSPGAMERLLSYPWPGNVRELENTINQSLVRLRGPVLVPEFLPRHISGETPLDPNADHERLGSGSGDLEALIRERMLFSKDLYAEMVEVLERQLIQIVFEHTDGNQSQAAEILGITRGKLRNRIRSFEITLGSNEAESSV